MSNQSHPVLIDNLNNELKVVEKWTKANRLTLNVEKTTGILFTNRPPQIPLPPLILEEKIVSFVNSTKFLGVIIDNNLTFKNHINSIVSKISRNTGIFYRIRSCLSQQARLNFY